MELAEIITVSPSGVMVDLAGGDTIRYDCPKSVEITVLHEVLELFPENGKFPTVRKDMGHAIKAVIKTGGNIETGYKVFAKELIFWDIDGVEYPVEINTETTNSPIRFHPEFQEDDSLEDYALKDREKDKRETLGDVGRKIERVRRAIKNPGVRPDYHSKQMFRLMAEWPALFYAVIELIDDED